jgi:Tol biopolymer transport system component
VAGDLSSGEAVLASGALVHAQGFSAVASGGKLIVYPASGGTHSRDLWAVRRSGGSWGAPVLLTGDSPYEWNDQPAISADGSRVIFDCGDQPYGAEGTAVCEVDSDGTGFSVVLTPAQGPGGANLTALHHPDYAPDGSIVFEADLGDEQIWRLPAGAREPVRVTTQFSNDNSPCVLPDGRIASLWLDRPGGSGAHEIKVMAPDGSSYVMLPTEVDVADIGLGCGG